jgi:hypothetical protein
VDLEDYERIWEHKEHKGLHEEHEEEIENLFPDLLKFVVSFVVLPVLCDPDV